MKKNKKKAKTSLPVSINFANGYEVSNLITKFDVKVMYEGINRNGTEFSKEVMEQFAKTLASTPIVGIYSQEEQDFQSHYSIESSIGEDGEFNMDIKYPVPYGFVPESAGTWFERVTDKDGVEREYLCTTAYLWTGRYPELERLKMGRNNQSMELNPQTIEGKYVETAEGSIFSFSKAEALGLCILGENVEPCFEGASFNYCEKGEDQFVKLLAQMKYELSETELEIEDKEEEVEEPAVEVEEPVVEEIVVEDIVVEEPTEETVEEEVEKVIEEETADEVGEEEGVENFESDEADENHVEEEEEEALADEVDLLAEIEDLRSQLAEKDSAYEAISQELAQTKELMESYSARIDKVDKIESLEANASRITKENCDAIASLFDSLTVEQVVSCVDKFETLNKYKEDITEENYNTLAEKVAELSVNEIESQAKDFAYENLKSILKNIATPKVEENNEVLDEEEGNTNSFTYSFKEESSKGTSASDEEWMRVVAQRRKNK